MWTCPKCSTKVDSSFEVCWNCGTSPDGVEDPGFLKADDAPPIEDPLYDPIAEPDPRLIGDETGELASDIATTHSADLVSAYQAGSLIEAKFLADQLSALGIPAMCDTQDFQEFMGVFDGDPHVRVRREDYDRARAWLESYEEKLRREAEEKLRRESGGSGDAV